METLDRIIIISYIYIYMCKHFNVEYNNLYCWFWPWSQNPETGWNRPRYLGSQHLCDVLRYSFEQSVERRWPRCDGRTDNMGNTRLYMPHIPTIGGGIILRFPLSVKRLKYILGYIHCIVAYLSYLALVGMVGNKSDKFGNRIPGNYRTPSFKPSDC